jgi:hypothetical protein
MEFRGSRIRAAIGSESVVAFAALCCRYQGKRRGFHGGACPAEMVVPCVVLRSSNSTVEWEDLPPYEPEWWSLRTAVSAIATPAIEQPAPTRRPISRRQVDLFQRPAEAPGGAAGWIEPLVVSPTYQQQGARRCAGRPRPSSSSVSCCSLISETDESSGSTSRSNHRCH